MKVIELLNKIANGEESDTITEFEFDKRIWNFFKLQDSEYCLDGWLLNQEIVITKHKEIIEEDKKIRKICTFPGLDDDDYAYEDGNRPNNVKINNKMEELLIDKINEIIGYINGGTNGE